jgi:ubiquinone/menaquinone biosynthesis C-methylase UbiE
MDEVAQRKWDAAAARYDLFSRGPELRWGPVKRELFSAMQGRVLFLAAGTGQDFQFFPPGQAIIAIDISGQMLARARPRAKRYAGRLELLQMNAHALAFADHAFDQVFTSCTFCSVPDPVLGLTELRRVLKPGGELRMFEHTGSRWFPFSLMLHLMNPVTRRFGPELIRNTPRNVQRAGFRIQQVTNVYLDVVKTIVATA